MSLFRSKLPAAQRAEKRVANVKKLGSGSVSVSPDRS